MQTETLIVGGGLSGLALAETLCRAGHDCLLVEARDRLGGRMVTASLDGAGYDLGPSWFWPGQPLMADLVQWLGLETFEQYDAGLAVVEDASGRVMQGRGIASMQGALRLRGGFGALIEALSAHVPPERRRTGVHVTGIGRDGDTIRAETSVGPISAHRAVLALPPRLAAALVPTLPEAALAQMGAIPTWMAGQAKAFALYDTAFWRKAGLSGDGVSRIGPLAEIHDASPEGAGPAALFGFVGVPPALRADIAALKAGITAQLARMFGPEAQAPREILVKDWARDPHTSVAMDHAPLTAHPRYGLPSGLASLWDGRLIISGTEVAPHNGGLAEGALEAAARVAAMLRTKGAVPNGG